MSDVFKNAPLRPFQHSIDGKAPSSNTVVNVDDRRLTPGTRPGTQRAFSTVFSPVLGREPYKDIQQDHTGAITPVEGPTKQTWINFGDAERAQHYVATYSQQHIKSDLQQNYSVGQQAAEVAKLMQARKAMKGKSEGFSSLKTSVQAIEARKNSGRFTPKEGTLFEGASERTRGKIASQRLNAWGDAGPVIRGFDVQDKTAHGVLSSSVTEHDKRVTRSEIINVDQTRAANQIGISGKAKQHLFKGAERGSLGSVVFNPKNMTSSFTGTAGKVGSLSSFEKQHGLKSTISVIARKTPKPPNPMPTSTKTVERASPGAKGRHK